MTDKQPILQLDRVCFGYAPDQPVLRGITLTLASGSVTAILGPNGCGKTTLLHSMLGRLRPDGGMILLEGTPLTDFAARARSRRMGLVPQSEHIPFDFTLLDYVLLGRVPYLGALELPGRKDYVAAREALARAGLEALAERSVTQMSGGERQLAMIARALAQRPAVLLLDEPTAHLDLANRRRVCEVLLRLSGEGITILFTTHDPALAAGLADGLVLMREGRVVEAGPLAEVMTSELLSRTYGLPVTVRRLENDWLITS